MDALPIPFIVRVLRAQRAFMSPVTHDFPDQALWAAYR